LEKRILTVIGQSVYNYKEAPTIRLHGRWLEGLGFKIGEQVTVEEECGRLVVSRMMEKKEPVHKSKLKGRRNYARRIKETPCRNC
jgi:hypothetical protein